MKPWTEMTNSEKVDWLAIRVMGWRSWQACSDSPRLWLDKDDLTAAYISVGDAVLDAGEAAPKLGDGLDGVFEPLRRYDHIALLRSAMRGKGYFRISQDGECQLEDGTSKIGVEYVYYKSDAALPAAVFSAFDSSVLGMFDAELGTEAEAMFNALDSSREKG